MIDKDVMDSSNKAWNDESDNSEEVAKLESVEIANDSITTTPAPASPVSTETVKPQPANADGFTPYSIGSAVQADTTHKARRFLIAYMTSVFAALVLLSGTATLGYALFDHFFGPKKEGGLWSYFDLAPLYLSVMASLVVFAVIYIVASRYVAKSASDDTIGLKDWRAYKVVYALFTALLITIAASIVASLLYIPLAQLLIAEDLQAKQVLVQVLASVHVLLWIVLLVWQERIVKKAKQSWLQGFVVVAAVAIVVLLTGIFPVGSKTNERFDRRAESDLTSIESKITQYQRDNKDKLPTDLSMLKIDADTSLKGRLTKYTYTVKQSTQKSDVSASSKKLQEALKSTANTGNDEEAYAMNYYDADEDSSSDVSTSTYELCATFRTDTTDNTDSANDLLSSALTGATTSSKESFDHHKSGKVCFTRGDTF